jgi:hypothetical protein
MLHVLPLADAWNASGRKLSGKTGRGEARAEYVKIP